MKSRFKILTLLFLFVIGCNSKQNNNTSVIEKTDDDSVTFEKLTKNNNSAIDSNISKVLDSLKIDTEIKSAKYFIYACEHLFDFNSLQFEFNNLSTGFLKDNIKIKSYNSDFLITINYEQWSTNGNSIKLFLYNNNLKELGNGELMGCHYHNDVIKIYDWNNDSIDEIQYRIDWPTQSVAYIEHIEEIYRFTESFDFENIFCISLETRDCSPTREEKGEVVERHYKFMNQKEIKVTELVFSFDCENFEWHDRINKKKKVNSNEYLMKWNENKKTFEKQQAGNKGYTQ
ncbi:MAG: hypothetical protein KDE33_21750 [Bacteroidetes bacterium]|nr:hypothetical protein [Bacteroidota bacterium]